MCLEMLCCGEGGGRDPELVELLEPEFSAMLLLFAQGRDETPDEISERVRVVLSRAAKRLELARNLVNRRLSEREAELQLRSGMSELERAVVKLQTFARIVFKFKKLVPS